MGHKKQIYREKLNQVGFWDYVEVYTMLFNWLKDHGYALSEDMYKEKLSGGGKEVIINWSAKRMVTDYFLYEITLSWHILGMKDAETEIDGKKTKMNKGELEIDIKASIINDYEQKWTDKPLNRFMRAIYEKYIIRTTVDEYEETLEEEVQDMINDLKAFLRIPVG
jgi:hypothetical protein